MKLLNLKPLKPPTKKLRPNCFLCGKKGSPRWVFAKVKLQRSISFKACYCKRCWKSRYREINTRGKIAEELSCQRSSFHLRTMELSRKEEKRIDDFIWDTHGRVRLPD